MESEARMKLAQEGARIVTWEWNLVTDAIIYSSNVEAVYGWRIESNDDFCKHVHADDIPMMNAVYDESLRTGNAHEFDFRIFQPDGSTRWISSRATPVPEFDGRIVKMVGISMDNTARKLVERRLQRQQARFKAVLQLSREGMALLDPELRCESANDALAQMLGYQLQTLEGMDFPALFVDGGARLRKALRGRQKADFISALKGADGEALDVSVRVLIDRDEDGVSEYCVVAVQAI